MKKLFIDCGGNRGQGLNQITNILKIDNDWDIMIYEPNPKCCEFLEHNFNRDNIKIFNKAVHDSDGFINFYIPKNDDYSVSSTIHNDFHNSLENKIWDNYIEVEKIDLSKHILTLKNEYDIYLKLDVEGSEYDILDKMIKDNSILYIKKLFVEFHNQYVSEEKLRRFDLDNRKKNIINYLKNNNIDFQIWH